LQNYKWGDGQDIILSKFTKITPVDKYKIGFLPMAFNASGLTENISSLEKLASEQLISLTAQVVHCRFLV